MTEYRVTIIIPYFSNEKEKKEDVRGYVNAVLDHLSGIYGSEILDFNEAQIEIKEA